MKIIQIKNIFFLGILLTAFFYLIVQFISYSQLGLENARLKSQRQQLNEEFISRQSEANFNLETTIANRQEAGLIDFIENNEITNITDLQRKKEEAEEKQNNKANENPQGVVAR